MSDAFENLSEWKHELLKGLRRRIDRRSFLRKGIGTLGGIALGGALLNTVLSRSAGAAGEIPMPNAPVPEPKGSLATGTFHFPRLKFDVLAERCVWDVYPDADANLRRQVRRLTSINMSEEPVVCSLDDLDGMMKYPFIFCTDQRHFRFSKKEEDNLAEYLKRGGFLYGDDCTWGELDGGHKSQSIFFHDYRDMMNKIWPDNTMRRVPDDHALYHCYFDMPKGLPYLQGEHEGSWATFDRKSDRILTLVTPTDMHCGWTCRFFTPQENMESLKMGINIIVYYLSH